jgi:hypothetical protein
MESLISQEEITTKSQEPTPPQSLLLSVNVRDAETVSALWQHQDLGSREAFALDALRIGVLALRHAQGEVDTSKVQREVDRMLQALEQQLAEHASGLQGSFSRALREYFDPVSGQLPQRLERLIGKDGELERTLSAHIGDDTSIIARTLSQHLGETSPLFRLLSPEQKDGLLAAISSSVEGTLEQQRQRFLAELSLDQPGSALNRLLGEIADRNGKLHDGLRTDLDQVRAEFSLDNDNGALARLVARVEKVQTDVAAQFSRDNEGSAISKMTRILETTQDEVKRRLTLDESDSPLALLQRQLLTVVEELKKDQHQLHTDLREAVASITATRSEAARSTRHGLVFEEAVGDVLADEAKRRGDLFEAVGRQTGHIKSCKVGDHLITLGPESVAPGARIVAEAKAKQGVTKADALAEIETGRRNRGARVGLLVFSATAQPQGIETLSRVGNDVLVVWDPDVPESELTLRVALSLACCLAIREARSSGEETSIDFETIDKAIVNIGKDAKDLDQISKWAETVRSSGEKIGNKCGSIQSRIKRQLAELEAEYGKLKTLHAGDAS